MHWIKLNHEWYIVNQWLQKLSLYSFFFVFYGIYTIIENKPKNIITIPKMLKNIQKSRMGKVLEWNFGNSNLYRKFWYLIVILK